MLLKSAAIMLVLSVGFALPVLAAAPLKASGRPVASLPPTRAASFLDTLGVNTHIFYDGPSFKAYKDSNVTVEALKYLGFRYVRDGGSRLTPAQAAKLADVANRAHIQFDFGIGVGSDVNTDYILQAIHAVLAAAPGSIASVEGSNEANNLFHAKSWAVSYKGQSSDMCAHKYGPLVEAQKALYQAVHSDPDLKNVPVYNFSIVPLQLDHPLNGCRTDYQADLDNIGDVTPYVDYANLHGYPFQGTAPSDYLKKRLLKPDSVHSRPIAFTETGYSTGDSVDAKPRMSVSESLQAKYELDAVLDLYRLGIARTFLYELLDDTPDTPSTDIEFHFGLFYADGRPKPSAKALHNLVSILRDPSPDALTFKPIPVTLAWTQSLSESERNTNEMHAFLQKADGTNEFIVWNEPPLWSISLHMDYPASPINKVKVHLPRKYPSINVYDPLLSEKPVGHFTDAEDVLLQVRDHPLILEFR